MDRILTLHFIDGTKLSFEFPAQAANAAARKLKVDDLMAGKHIVIEAEGSVMVFPVVNIKYIAISVPPLAGRERGSALPRHAIVGARIRT
jgi:hypothetical protein